MIFSKFNFQNIFQLLAKPKSLLNLNSESCLTIVFSMLFLASLTVLQLFPKWTAFSHHRSPPCSCRSEFVSLCRCSWDTLGSAMQWWVLAGPSCPKSTEQGKISSLWRNPKVQKALGTPQPSDCTSCLLAAQLFLWASSKMPQRGLDRESFTSFLAGYQRKLQTPKLILAPIHLSRKNEHLHLTEMVLNLVSNTSEKTGDTQ